MASPLPRRAVVGACLLLLLGTCVPSGAGEAGADGVQSSFPRNGPYRRLLQADGEVRLRSHVELSALYKDSERTCYAPGDLVKRGTPSTCGFGCQYASSVVDISSEFVDAGFPTSRSIVGPPDVFPNKGYNRDAWAPLTRDTGEQYIAIAVLEPVYVTGLEVYETDHPGAIVRIEGRFDNSSAWVEMWSGEPSVPEGSSVYDVATATFSTAARIFKPVVRARREERLGQFRLTLNTAAANGYNQIDAVKVMGDGGNGVPSAWYTPRCGAIGQTDCWHECGAADVLDEERSTALLTMLSQATGWVASALRVAAPPGGALVLPEDPAQDANFQQCGGVPIPPALMSDGVHGSQVVIFATSRPSAEPLAVMPCRYDGTAASLGRPIAMHLNVVPQFAQQAVAAAAADPVTDDVLRGATDAVTQYLYRGLGWASQFHDDFLSYRGVDVVEERNAACDSAEACAAGWESRYLLVIPTPRVVEKAKEHFGVPTLSYVELENQGPPGVKGTLLEHRLFNGELMTLAPYVSKATYAVEGGWAFPTTGVRPMARSAVSLGYLEDTGWYAPDYSAAEPLHWGYKQGLDFVTRQCNYWPESASTYVCPTSPATGVFDSATPLDTPMCTADRTHVGTCGIVNYPRPRQGPFQYFLRPQEGNLGGTNELADFCPLTLPEPSSTGAAPAGVARDCRAPVATGDRPLEYFEEVGLASRCFTGERSRRPVVGCFKHACENGVLFLKLEGEYKPCPAEGGPIYFTDARMTLNCPRYSDMCHSYALSVPPSLAVLSPVRDGERIETAAVVALEVARFSIPDDGVLRVLLDGVTHAIIAQDPSPGELIKQVQLTDLPRASRLVELAFELVDPQGNVAFRASRRVAISLFPPDLQGEDAGQYAATIEGFSSEYTFPGEAAFERYAAQLLGPPNVPGYGSSQFAWAPAQGGAGTEFVNVRVARPVYVYAVEIFESFSPGGLTKVMAYNDEAEEWEVVFQGTREFPTPPAAGAAITPTQVATRVPSFKASVFRLEFTTPSWVEIDAVKVLGYLETPRTVEMPAEPVVVTVGVGQSATVTVRIPVTGTSSVFWYIKEGQVPWLSLGEDEGVVPGASDEMVLEITVDASSPSALVLQTELLIANPFALSGADNLALLPITLVVDVAAGARPTPPPCYHGLVVGASETSGGECRCVPGAYGLSCESLRCPRNCSSDFGGVMRGVCHASTGRCQCASGFTGHDCSGQDGDCYVSFDGFCREGWEYGSYIINSEDEDNMNKGGGVLPARMQCSDDNPNGNTFGCSTYITLELCCRGTQAPACPFLAGAAPCEAEACAAGAWAEDAACLAQVHEYCFSALGDPACNTFKPIPPPAGFCPDGLALQFCAGNPEAAECAASVAPRPLCGFLPGPVTSPCGAGPCEEDLFGLGCKELIAAHCAAVPTDRECELHGLGNGCMFADGSPPCDAVACYEGTHDEEACMAAIDFHCRGTAGPSDPECSVYGYGDPPLSASPQSAACQWAAARAQCALTPEDEVCILLRMYGLVDGQVSGGALPRISVLERARVEAAEEGMEAFVSAGLALDAARRGAVERHVLYAGLFAHADADGDGRLGPGELQTVAMDVASAGALGAPTFLNALPEEAVAEAMAAPGGFFSREELTEAFEHLYDMWLESME